MATASSISELLQGSRIQHLAARIEAAAQPSIRLDSGEATDGPVSRLGGVPNMPAEWGWPTNHDGWPLAFIAQIALGGLPRLEGYDLPTDGSLYFFHDGESWGFKPEDIGSCRVLYGSDPLAKHSLHPLPDDDLEYQFKGVELSVRWTEKTIPDLRDISSEAFELQSKEDRSAYGDFEDRWAATDTAIKHRMGGHLDLIQGDAKIEANLVSHGIYCGDSEGWKLGREKGLFAGAKDWQLLLQVDSDEKAEMQWGDSGRIYFLIHKDDLAARRFEKSRLVLQCF